MLFFFFFKQKTAYEMRISDWSSDVCSSDLAAAELPALHSTHPGLWAARGTHAGGRTRHPQHPHLALFQRRAGSRAPSISALPFAYPPVPGRNKRSEEHTSELQSLMRISYAVFCLKKKNNLINRQMKKYHMYS